MKIEFATSKSGHDKNQVYLLLEQEKDFVYLVNGVTKPLEHPKKKNRKHVQIIKNLPIQVEEVLKTGMTDITIKKAINEYLRISKQEANPPLTQRGSDFCSAKMKED